MYFLLKYVKNLGSRIEKIIKNHEHYDLKPLLQESDNGFLVMSPNINYKAIKKKFLPSNLTQQEQILEYLTKYKKNQEL